MSARIDGIDLSHYQGGALDFARAHRAGVRFVYHKATEGTGYRDPMHDRRRGEVAKVPGIRFGAYHFARPHVGNAQAEARHFLAVANPRPGDMRPMLDLEVDGGLSRAQLTTWVRTFVGEVKKATGEVPFIYTHFDLDQHFDCPLWVARYSDAMYAPHTPRPWKRHTIWQFSDGQYGHPSTVPGIGRCDINTMNGDPAALVDVFTLGGPRPPVVKAAEAVRKPTPRPNFEAIDKDAAAAVKGNPAGSAARKVAQKVRSLVKGYVRPGK